MKEIFASVDKARRIVLPRQVIEALALAPGDVLSVCVRNAKIILRAQKRVPRFIRKGRALVFSAGNGAFLKPSGVQQIINRQRKPGRLSIVAGFRRKRSG